MSAIFISHSSSDNELAVEVARRLAERHHASVFLDLDPEKGIVGGQSWERTLYRKLRACRLVIALCTDAYLRSHWCFAEIALARMEGKPILALQAPALAAGAPLPSILTEKQFIDLRRDPEEGWRRFWRALDALDLAGVAGEWDPSQPPYLGLSAYQEEHAPVFFGREDEILAGVELLERGAPGLIMVLGASGSGKSSLAHAGIVPRLRSAPERWLVVDPVRPGRDPDAELVESLVRAFARYARDHVAESGGLERTRAQLRDALETPACGDARAVDEPAPSVADAPRAHALEAQGADGPQRDQRLQRLVELLERLRDDPPASLPPRLRNHLAWSLEDLLRLSGTRRIEPAAPPTAAAAASPLVDIAEHLRRVAGQRSARVLIVVDQFEELLGHAEASTTASRFLARLRAAMEAQHSPLMVLATMRSDFLAPFQRHPSLQGIDFESLSLGPMRVDGMQRVIQMPARLAALEIEDGLTERLIADTGTPDALPLLSFTLWVMYRDRRDAGRLELAGYDRLGGLQGTISREADAVREAAARRQREDDLRISLLQLARLSEDGSYARRPADWDQPEIARARDILEQLVERRVLVSRVEGGTAVVEVAHEALFRTWTPLRTWLDNARADLLLRRQLDRDASAWREGGRAPDLLWRGGRLLQARDLVGRRRRGSADPASEFVQAGMRRRRSVQGIAGGLTLAAFIVLAGFLWYALDQADQARRQEARAVDLARVAVGGEWLLRDPTLGALMLLEIADTARTPFLAGKLSDALVRGFAAAEYRDQGPVHGIDISADGTHVVTVSGKQARIWEARSGRLLQTLDHPDTVVKAAFDPTGRFVLVRAGTVDEAHYMDAAGQRAWVWKLGEATPHFESRHQAALAFAAFSADGRTLATASADGAVQLWDVDRAQPRRPPLAHPEKVEGVAFSPDGTRLATASNGLVRLWPVDSGEPMALPDKYEGGANAIAFSPDGRVLAVAGSGDTRLWNVAPPALLHTLDTTWVRSLAFSLDSRLLAVGSPIATQVFDVAGGGALLKEPIKPQGLQGVRFVGDASMLVTVSGHATRNAYSDPPIGANALRYWDASTGEERYVRRLDPAPEALATALDATARYAAVNYGEQVGSGRPATYVPLATARLWNVTTDDPRRVRVLTHQAAIAAAAFSPVGQRLVTASGADVRLWDPLKPEPVFAFRHAGTVFTAAFSADGAFVVTASDDGTARVSDAESGQPVFVVRHAGRVERAWLLPGNALLVTHSNRRFQVRRLAAGPDAPPIFEHESYESAPDHIAVSADGRLMAYRAGEAVRVWEAGKKDPLPPLKHEGYVRRIAFAGDGSLLVTSGDEKVARIWDPRTGASLHVLRHAAQVEDLAVAPDGGTVLTIDSSGAVRLWDARKGVELKAFEHGCGSRYFAAFAAQGRLAVTRSQGTGFKAECEGRVRLWDVATRQPLVLVGVGAAEDVALSPDGRLVASLDQRSGWDRTWRNAESRVRVWDADTGRPRFADSFDGRERMQTVKFSADGSLLMTVAGAEVALWAVSAERLRALVDAATSVCLTPDFRRQALGESAAVAAARHDDCERRHGRLAARAGN